MILGINHSTHPQGHGMPGSQRRIPPSQERAAGEAVFQRPAMEGLVRPLVSRSVARTDPSLGSDPERCARAAPAMGTAPVPPDGGGGGTWSKPATEAWPACGACGQHSHCRDLRSHGRIHLIAIGPKRSPPGRRGGVPCLPGGFSGVQLIPRRFFKTASWVCPWSTRNARRQ